VGLILQNIKMKRRKLMATLLTGQTAVSRSPQLLTSGGSAGLNTNEFFFYSNSPETLDWIQVI
jgi:hypothetical protein